MKKFFKKAACAVMATVMTAGVCAFSASALLGDLNDSGKLQSSDARLLLRYSAKLESLDDAHLALADFNYDGRVNSGDARILLRAAAKIEDLEFYRNYFYKATTGGTTMTMGFNNGDLYAEMPSGEIQLAFLLSSNGDFTVIDHKEKVYGVLKESEWNSFVTAMKNFAKMQGQEIDTEELEKFNFRDMAKEITGSTENIAIPKPLKLLELGYEKGTATWQGEEVTTYNNDVETYYFKGDTLVGLTSENQSVSYADFTSTPSNSDMYAYLRGEYKEEDFLVFMMKMMDNPNLDVNLPF